MLNLITKSKINQRIILLFVYNPEKSYYINEVARLVGTSAGNAQRALEKFGKEGLLSKEKRGNLVYFRTNVSNPLFVDFKNLVDKTIGIATILHDELTKLSEVQFAFLFGSYVKGDFKADSDIDLYVIGNIHENKLYTAVHNAEMKINREINYHFSTLPEFNGQYKKSFFHSDILKNHRLIIGDKNEFGRIIR